MRKLSSTDMVDAPKCLHLDPRCPDHIEQSKRLLGLRSQRRRNAAPRLNGSFREAALQYPTHVGRLLWAGCGDFVVEGGKQTDGSAA